mgnify:CR=1 FL=1
MITSALEQELEKKASEFEEKRKENDRSSKRMREVIKKSRDAHHQLHMRDIRREVIKKEPKCSLPITHKRDISLRVKKMHSAF